MPFIAQLDLTPARACTEVGPGDYVLSRKGQWLRIASNTAFKRLFIPREWTVITEDGDRLGVFDCLRYAKASDLNGSAPEPRK